MTSFVFALILFPNPENIGFSVHVTDPFTRYLTLSIFMPAFTEWPISRWAFVKNAWQTNGLPAVRTLLFSFQRTMQLLKDKRPNYSQHVDSSPALAEGKPTHPPISLTTQLNPAKGTPSPSEAKFQ